MEFGEAKKQVWVNLTSAINEFDILKEEHDCNDIEGGWDIVHSIQNKMDDSKNLQEFLTAVPKFYEEIGGYISSKYYSIDQAEKMRTILSQFSEAIIRMLSGKYAVKEYDEILEMDEFNALLAYIIFILGAALTKESDSSKDESVAVFVDKAIFGKEEPGKGKPGEEEPGKGRPVEEEPEKEESKKEESEKGESRKEKRRKDVYEKVLSYCKEAIEKGILARDQYLKILLEYFTESDWGPTFVIEVNRLISPCDLADDAKVDSRVDNVIKDHFHKLSDQQKLDIIEQCSYHDITKNGFLDIEKKDADSSLQKVLEKKIRQHVVCMIGTMWLEAENEDQVERNRELLKFHSVDCAYVSAMIKKDLPLGGVEFIDSHDTAKTMQYSFNIVISDIHVLVMKLKGEEIEIHVHGKRQEPDRERCCDESYKVPFSKDDWELDKVDEILKTQNISRKVTEYCSDPDGSDFRYSLIYMENYRGINHMSVSFDHKFSIARDDQTVRLTEEKAGSKIKNFYGKKIISMTGFVGKNGAGKTSVVDFLRDSFLRICNDLYDGELTAEDGVINMKPGQAQQYRLKEDVVNPNGEQFGSTRFFVVFYFMEKYFYLTNMKVRRVVPGGEKSEGKGTDGLKEMRIPNNNSIAPYQIGEMLPLYGENRKIVYFSQFLAPAGVAARENERCSAQDRNLDEGDGDGTSLFAADKDVWQKQFRESDIINLSEEALNAMRTENTGQRKEKENISLFMQLVFYFCKKDSFEDYFGKDFVPDDLEVSSMFAGGSKDGQGTVKLKDLKGTLLEQVLKDPVAYIRPFSSGQYSKFVLLSRLFWCIKGWDVFPAKLSEKKFNKDEAFSNAPGWDNIRDMVGRYLKKADSAILFFDEADVYYHPDWQRGFVQDIMTMIEEYSEIPFQIVFTTNAPLMLSDLQQRDIYLMKNQSDSSDVAERESANPSVQTFGQNIHTLMAKPFFLDRTIGVFADQRIKWLIGLMIDVSSIVSFSRDRERNEEEKSKVWSNLFENHREIYDKAKAIFDAVKTLGSGEGKNAIRKKAAEIEREYVAEQIRKKELMDFGSDEGADVGTDESSYGLVLEFLQNHIKLIGEDVLRNELLDMFNDFRTRIDRGVKLETLIEQKEKELEDLKKRYSEVSCSGEPSTTE